MAGRAPGGDLITDRYPAHRRPYVRSALERLAEAEGVDPDAMDNTLTAPVVVAEPLAAARWQAVLTALRAQGPTGCSTSAAAAGRC